MNFTEVTHEDLMIEINHRNIETDNLLTLKEKRELSVLHKNMTHFVVQGRQLQINFNNNNKYLLVQVCLKKAIWLLVITYNMTSYQT